MSKSTRKKVKIVGTEKYINQKTGELQEMQVINIEERDANFDKIWLWHIADALDLIGNQKTKVLYHIMENRNSENQYIGTQRTIAEKTKISYQTVSLTIKALQEADFLRMLQAGVYVINPDMIFRGGKDKRFNVLLEYNSIGNNEQPEEKQTDGEEGDEKHE